MPPSSPARPRTTRSAAMTRRGGWRSRAERMREASTAIYFEGITAGYRSSTTRATAPNAAAPPDQRTGLSYSLIAATRPRSARPGRGGETFAQSGRDRCRAHLPGRHATGWTGRSSMKAGRRRCSRRADPRPSVARSGSCMCACPSPPGRGAGELGAAAEPWQAIGLANLIRAHRDAAAGDARQRNTSSPLRRRLSRSLVQRVATSRRSATAPSPATAAGAPIRAGPGIFAPAPFRANSLSSAFAVATASQPDPLPAGLRCESSCRGASRMASATGGGCNGLPP